MSQKYKVKEKTDKKQPYWIVVTERGFIANGVEHKTLKEAERHCENVNAYCV